MKTQRMVQVQDELEKNKINWEKEVGTINLKGDAVSLVRKVRRELSKEVY